MPMLVRTPEEIFRTEKKDIYVLITEEGLDKENSLFDSVAPENLTGLRMMKTWLQENMPGVGFELLAPSEYSGFISGGIGRRLRMDLSPEQLSQFCDRWEVNDKSIDPRFQCYIIPYQKWFEEHGQYVPTMERPHVLGLTIWWYTPKGFIHHQISHAQALAKNLDHHPANEYDIWAHVLELWPEMGHLNPSSLTHGRITMDLANQRWFAVYTPPASWPAQDIGAQPTKKQIRDWFNLPPGVKLVEDSY